MQNDLNLYKNKCTIYNSLFIADNMDDIVNESENILENPIFILDTSYHVITRSRLAKEENSSLQFYNGKYYLSHSIVNKMKKERCIDNIYKSYGSFFYNGMQNLIFCPIKINCVTTFYICVLEKHKIFDPYDLEFVNILANVLSVQLQKENIFIANSGYSQEYYLEELLSNKIDDIEDTLKRLERMNFSIRKNFVILSIPFKQNFINYKQNFGLKQLIKNIQSILTNSISTYYNDTIVFLISTDDRTFSRNISDRLIHFLELNNLKCGVSLTFDNLYDIKDYFSQASYALKISNKLCRNECMIFFENYIEYYLFSSNSYIDIDKIALHTLIHPYIKLLQNYDSINNSNLLETLKSYFINDRNAIMTSLNLNIHKSTFFYRFHKIEDILGISLDDSNLLFKLELSIKILDYINNL